MGTVKQRKPNWRERGGGGRKGEGEGRGEKERGGGENRLSPEEQKREMAEEHEATVSSRPCTLYLK